MMTFGIARVVLLIPLMFVGYNAYAVYQFSIPVYFFSKIQNVESETLNLA